MPPPLPLCSFCQMCRSFLVSVRDGSRSVITTNVVTCDIYIRRILLQFLSWRVAWGASDGQVQSHICSPLQVHIACRLDSYTINPQDCLNDEVSVLLYTRFASRWWPYSLLFNSAFPSHTMWCQMNHSLLSDPCLFIARDYSHLTQSYLSSAGETASFKNMPIVWQMS